MSEKELEFYLKELWRGFFYTKCIVKLTENPDPTKRPPKKMKKSSSQIKTE